VLGSVVVKRSNRLLILLGLLIAISGSLAAMAYVAGSGGGGGSPAAATPSATAEATVPVVYATKDIAAGTIITADMVSTKPLTLSAKAALGVQTYSSVSQVVGSISGVSIKAGQDLASGQLLTPGSAVDGKSLSPAVDKGMVAISMELDQTNGVGTLIVPGDHVDIILTVYADQLAISGADAAGTQISLAGGQQVTSKMIFQNCKVLETLLPPAAAVATSAPVAGATAAAVAPQVTSPVVQMTGRHMLAIVEVFPEQAEVIRWAQRAETGGTQNYIDLAFALRSTQDDGDPVSSNTGSKTSGITFSVLVAKYGVLPLDPTGIIPPNLGIKVQW
jgi:Flp pilus assembly protein CpaB